MTLPAKGRRRIRLECGSFRYIFKPDKFRDRGRLLIEPKYGNTTTLIVQWFGLIDDNPAVLPRRFIENVIQYAIKKDWPQTQLEFACLRTGEDLDYIDRPAGASNDWPLTIPWPKE